MIPGGWTGEMQGSESRARGFGLIDSCLEPMAGLVDSITEFVGSITVMAKFVLQTKPCKIARKVCWVISELSRGRQKFQGRDDAGFVTE